MPQRVTELHCIMPIGNVPSVMQHGLLSHEPQKGRRQVGERKLGGGEIVRGGVSDFLGAVTFSPSLKQRPSFLAV